MDAFTKLLDELVRINRVNRTSMRDCFHNMGPAAFAESLSTVRLGVGRMIGKTSYIKQRAKAGDLVVVINTRTRDEIFGDCRAEVISARQLKKEKALPRFATIYVDDQRYVFQEVGEKDLYAKLARDPDQIFVFLGE